MILVSWHCNPGIQIWDKEEMLLILPPKNTRKYAKLTSFITLSHEPLLLNITTSKIQKTLSFCLSLYHLSFKFAHVFKVQLCTIHEWNNRSDQRCELTKAQTVARNKLWIIIICYLSLSVLVLLFTNVFKLS